jgi:hypothetical protein
MPDRTVRECWNQPIQQKRCPDCGEVKPNSAYRRNKSTPDGLSFYCKDCFRQRDSAGYRKRMAERGRKVRERVSAPPGHKWCPGCESIKPFGDWGRNRASKDGYNSYCKACHNKRSAREYLKRVYGLTPDDVKTMIEAQAGLCCVCLRAPAEHVDHDHATGKVRGVLCFNCNVAIGQFRDDSWLLRRAIRYLDRTLVGPRKVGPGLVEITTVGDELMGDGPAGTGGFGIEVAPRTPAHGGKPRHSIDVPALRAAARAPRGGTPTDG